MKPGGEEEHHAQLHRQKDNMEIGDGEDIENAPGGVSEEGHGKGGQQPQEHPEKGLGGVNADGLPGITLQALLRIVAILRSV